MMLTQKEQRIKAAMQPVLSRWLKHYRSEHNLTQEKMSMKFMISLRAYVRLEHGDSFPSALTLAYFLTMLDKDELRTILQELRTEIEKVR